MNEYPTIVYSFGPVARQAGGDPLSDAIVSALSAGDAPFEAVWDLCELAARRDPAIARWAAAGDLRVVGLARRAVKWLFHAAGAELPEAAEVLDPETMGADEMIRRLRVENLGTDTSAVEQSRRAGTTESVPVFDAVTVVLYEGPGAGAMEPERLAELVCSAVAAGYRVIRPGRGVREFAADTAVAAVVGEFGGAGRPAGLVRGAGDVCVDANGKCSCGVVAAIGEARERAGLPRPGAWVPWFPVIDYERCVGCNQCANFCLFGVYTTDGSVRVARPDACKTNCPACARMCPQAAIIFPYYPTGPINGRQAAAGAPAQVDLKQALKGDVYEMLRNRGRGGGAAANVVPSPADLARIAGQVEIPPQVLMSLGAAAAVQKAPCGCACDCSGDGGACACAGDDDCGCDCDCHRDQTGPTN